MVKEITLATFMERMDERFGQISSGIAEFRQENTAQLEVLNLRLEKVEQRLEKVEHRLEKLELRMDSLDSRLESVETRLKLVESEVTHLGERLTRLEDVTNGLLGSFVMLMNQSEIRYNETKGRFELVDGRAGTHESNQADTDLRLTSLEETVKDHNAALAELRKAG